MKKLLNLTLLLITLSLFTSCDKQLDTDIEIIQNHLQSFTQEKGITKCTIIILYGEKSYTEYEDVEFAIDNGFVVIKDRYGVQDSYNLMYLSKYMCDTHNQLTLYFANTFY